MPFTSFTDKVNNLNDSNNDAKLHTELKKFFADANNRRLMWAESGKALSQDHAKKVAEELKTLDEKKQALLKNGVAEAMKNLTARINGELVSCADILANDWERAKAQNIPELKQAAALVSLHYMLTNDKALLYDGQAQEYAKQFCDDPENISSVNKVPVGLPSNPMLFDPYKAEDGKFYSYDGTSWTPTIEEIIVKPVEGNGKPVEGNGKPVEGNGKPVEGNGKPVEGGTETPSTTPTIDPIPENTPDNTNTTEAMDGVPNKITAGTDRVENNERKDHLISSLNKELNGVIEKYFKKDELGNNKENENTLITNFLVSSFNQFKSKEEFMKPLIEKQTKDLEKFTKDNQGKGEEETKKLTEEFKKKQAIELEKASDQYDTIKYETVKSYYTSLLDQLINHPREEGNKIVIPKSASVDESGNVTLLYDDKVNVGIGRPNKKLEGKERGRYESALQTLSANTDFLIGKTTKPNQVYSLGLNKVDIQLPAENGKETTGQKNIDLKSKTEYYAAIQIENNATNSKLTELTKEYTTSLSVIQKTTSEIFAENKKLNDVQLKPQNKIEAQVKLVSLNQQLLEEELKLLTTGSLISTLAGAGTSSLQSTEELKSTEVIETRMGDIKKSIKGNADTMKKWIENNEESLKSLNNTDINTQINTIKLAITDEYVQSQEYIVDSLVGLMKDSKELFARINKPYQEAEKLIKTYQSQRTYWVEQITALQTADPQYITLDAQYEKNVIDLDKNIGIQQTKQANLLKEFADAVAKATKEKEDATKEKEKAVKEKEKANTKEKIALADKNISIADGKIAVADRKIALRSTLKNGDKLYMTQSEANTELKSLVDLSTEASRTNLLSQKESKVKEDIDLQTTNNKKVIDDKLKKINEDKKLYVGELTTIQKNIDTKENLVKQELEKAKNNKEYNLQTVTTNQFELLAHYQEKQQFLDKYNDTYDKDQINYQAGFDNHLIGTKAQKQHTEQNIDRLKDQIAEVDKDIATKRKLVMDIEAQITELVTTSTTDPVYQEYVNSEIARLTALMNTTIRELTADETLIDPNNRRKTLEKFMAYDFEFEFTTSKPKEGSLCAVSNKLHELYVDEEKQAIKRGQATDFEQSRIDYIGTNAQTSIMKEKLAFYGEYNAMLLDQIADYTKSIAKNTEDIDIKKGQLKLIAGDTETEKILNADIAKLTSENDSLIKLRDDISARQTKLQQTLDAAQGRYATMVTNNENTKKVMNTNESTLVNNKTALYIDQSSTLYDAGKLNEERMKYKPYKAGEVSSTELKTELPVQEVVETPKENLILTEADLKLTEYDRKYLDKVTSYRKKKGVVIPEPLPIFHSNEEAKGKFGVLMQSEADNFYRIGYEPEKGETNDFLQIKQGIGFYSGVDNKNKYYHEGEWKQEPIKYNRETGVLEK